MRTTIKLALGASAIAIAAPASAATYVWASGNYVSGTTSPNPLLAPDILSIETAANKFFNGGTFTNQSGTVDWVNGNLYLNSGAQVFNQSLWRATGNEGIYTTSGTGSFTNSGTFSKDGGIGTTTLSFTNFINSGTIDAQTGTILLSGANKTFNDGSNFTGGGVISLTGNATFNGGFTSTNLDFAGSGTYTAGAGGASLSGSADFLSGSFTGDWTVASDGTLSLNGLGNKFFNTGTFTNEGVANWSQGLLYINSGGNLVNDASFFATGDSQISTSSGVGTFTNNGTFSKTGGAGTTTLSITNFINSGTIDAQTGTILLSGNNKTFNDGSDFIGAGVISLTGNATFNGGFTSSNLDFAGSGTYTGNAAVLNGSADFLAGAFTGDWTVDAGASLNITGLGNKFFNTGTFTNDGTATWGAGSLFINSNGQLVNSATFIATGNNAIATSSGVGTFTNDGTFRKDGADGTTTIQNTTFVNNGTIDAQTGTILLSSANKTINAGSIFTGPGVIQLSGAATFNGGFTSSNLDLIGGTYTGVGASLSGSADFLAGTFTGDWTVASDGALNLSGLANKFFSTGTFTNEGTANWTAGNLYVDSGGQLVNSATFIATGNDGIYTSSGVGTFTNDGTFRKDGGAGTTTIQISNFVNNGTLDAQTGTILLSGANKTINAGSIFTGPGVISLTGDATFNGGFTSSNLDFAGSGTYTGVGASLSGSADFVSGTFTGGWTVASDGELNVTGLANKFFSTGTFTNAGTTNWAAGNLYVNSGGQFANTGTFSATGDDGIYTSSGVGTFTNSGLFEKTGGTGTTTIGNVGFTNTAEGTMNVTSGTIALPSNFVNDGTLAGTGSYTVGGTIGLTNNGTIAPGDLGAAGTLGLTGNYVQTVTGTLASQIASSAISDLFNISGSAALNGTLALSCITSCAISTGDTFVLLNSGSLSGVFSNVTTSGFLNGFSYDVIYDYANSQVRLSVLDAGMAPPTGAVPEPGTWAMMILGFGMVGGAIRRRRHRRAKLIYILPEAA